MAQRIDELKLLNNSIYYFITENYEVTENEEHWVELDVMYEEYKEFCHKVGAKGIFKKNVFGKEKAQCNKLKREKESKPWQKHAENQKWSREYDKELKQPEQACGAPEKSHESKKENCEKQYSGYQRDCIQRVFRVFREYYGPFNLPWINLCNQREAHNKAYCLRYKEKRNKPWQNVLHGKKKSGK